MGMSRSSRILHRTGNETLPEFQQLHTGNKRHQNNKYNRIISGKSKSNRRPSCNITRTTLHPATPFLQQGIVINDAMKQLTKIFAPPKREETAMAAPSPMVLETL
jgi:hypothetical protein